MDKTARDWPQPVLAEETRRDASRQALLARKWWLIGMVVAALALFGAAYGAEPVRYNAEAQVQTGPRLEGLLGLRSSAANSSSTGRVAAALGQARLLASRDLARRVIKELGIENDREFDPGPDGLGFGSRALVFLGLKRNPARRSPEDRILEAFQERLRVRGPDRRGVLTIAFQSETPELAARAANRLAELYIDMRTGAGKAEPAPARIVAFAAAPPYPVQANSLLLAGAAMAALAFGALVTLVLPRLRGRFDEPVVQPKASWTAQGFARIKLSERLSQRIAARSEPPLSAADEPAVEDPEDGQPVATAVACITGQRVHVRRGVRIVAPEPMDAAAESYLAPAVARELARQGRTIAICLNSLSLSHFRVTGSGPQFAALPFAEPLLHGLLEGRASFTEVICRDPCSRLHLLPIRQGCGLDLHELQKIIDALAETYDYVVTMAPQIEGNDTARILARECDLALLESPACANGSYLAVESQLIESCTGEVLLLGLEKGKRALARSAA